MHKAAGRFALQLSSDIDYRALSWMFKTLNDDDEFEQFFDALPSLYGSKALKDAESKLIVPNEESLSHALIGMMDRTLLSELVSEEVKQRRIIICTKAVGATSLLGPKWTLRRVLCGEWHGFSRSIHFGLCVQDWKNISHPLLVFYAQCAVAVTLTSVQKRDDHWFRLASGQLNQSKSLLRDYFATNDSILLNDAIFIVRRTMEAFSGLKDHQSDIREASSKTLELICSFNIKETSEDLQNRFCSLWNDLVYEAEENADPDFRSLCIMMLKSIRRLYITQHEDTRSAPKEFSTTTDDSDRVLGYARSYPMCRDHTHDHSGPVSESKLDELPGNAPRFTARLVGVVSASVPSVPVTPLRMSTPTRRISALPLDQTPFGTDRNRPHPFIPSPNFPVAPPARPSNPGVSGPYNSYPYSATTRSRGLSQMEPPRDGYMPAPADIVPHSRPESPFDFSRTVSISQMAHHSEYVPAAMGEVYSQQGANAQFAPSEASSTSSFEVPMIDIEPPSPTESLSDIPRTDYHHLSPEHAERYVRFAPSESPSTSSSNSLEIAIVGPSESPESSPPESPLDITPMTFRAEDVPAVMGEDYPQHGAHVLFSLSESNSTSPSESLEIIIEAPSESPESSPPESPLNISPMTFRAEDVPAVMGEVYSQHGAHVLFSPSESDSMSPSESLEIVIEAPSESPESSPPGSPLQSSPMVILAEDVPAVMGEIYPLQGANVRFAPSKSTSMSFSESPVIDTVTTSSPESPYIAAVPIPPAPAGSSPSIDASLGRPRTPRMATVLLPSEMMPMTVEGGGSEPMPSLAVRAGVVAQTPMAILPPDSVLVDAKVTMPLPLLGAGGVGGMAPVLKFNGYGKFAGLLYNSPHSVMHEDDLYPTALHLFEAHKFLYHRPDLADRIRQCERVEEVTALSEELGEFVRRDWSNVALSTVSNLFLSFLPVFHTVRVLAQLMLIAVGGCLDGRYFIPQVPAA
jgi:hypothetical protein